MISLLYVSRAAFGPGDEQRYIRDILTTARERNLRIGVTGALVYLGGHFVQILEGEAAEVNQLMIDILRDLRHRNVRIIEVTPIRQRRFAQWGMAWVPASPGPSSYAEALTEGGDDRRTPAAAAALIDYMSRFAEA